MYLISQLNGIFGLYTEKLSYESLLVWNDYWSNRIEKDQSKNDYLEDPNVNSAGNCILSSVSADATLAFEVFGGPTLIF